MLITFSFLQEMEGGYDSDYVDVEGESFEDMGSEGVYQSSRKRRISQVGYIGFI